MSLLREIDASNSERAHQEATLPDTAPLNITPKQLGLDSLYLLLNLIPKEGNTRLRNQLIRNSTRIFNDFDSFLSILSPDLKWRSPSNFMPDYITSEYNKTEPNSKTPEDIKRGLEISRKESIAGGAGVWRNKIDFEPINLDSNSLNTILQNIDNTIKETASTNQQQVRQIYEKVRKQYGLPDRFEDRFKAEFLDLWLNVLGQSTNEEGEGVKDLEVKLGVGKDRKRAKRFDLSAIWKSEYQKDEGAPLIINVVKEDELEKYRNLNEVAERGIITKVILVLNKQGQLVSIETLHNHFNSNQRQGKKYMENILKNLSYINPKETNQNPEVLRKTVLPNNEAFYDIDQKIVLDNDIGEFIKIPLKKLDPKMNLSTFLLLAKMLTHEKLSSGYICVQPSKTGEQKYPATGELTMTLVPRPISLKLTKLKSVLIGKAFAIENGNHDIYDANLLNIEKIIMESVTQLNKYVTKDIHAAKAGYSAIAMLQAFIPDSLKSILLYNYPKTNSAISDGPSQISSIGKADGLMSHVSFTTALSLGVNEAISCRVDHQDRLEIGLRQRHKALSNDKEVVLRSHNDQLRRYIETTILFSAFMQITQTNSIEEQENILVKAYKLIDKINPSNDGNNEEI